TRHQGVFRGDQETLKLRVLHATPLRQESYHREMWCQGTIKVYDAVKPHLFDDPDNVCGQKRLWYLFREITIEDWSSRDISNHLNLFCDVASYGALTSLLNWCGG